MKPAPSASVQPFVKCIEEMSHYEQIEIL